VEHGVHDCAIVSIGIRLFLAEHHCVFLAHDNLVLRNLLLHLPHT
jgi:hypothetical protein